MDSWAYGQAIEQRNDACRERDELAEKYRRARTRLGWDRQRLEDCIEETEAERDRYAAALREIEGTDPVDNALDPQRPGRIAREALGGNDG